MRPLAVAASQFDEKEAQSAGSRYFSPSLQHRAYFNDMTLGWVRGSRRCRTGLGLGWQSVSGASSPIPAEVADT
eukprot:1823105-Amphidinium_carterae.1